MRELWRKTVEVLKAHPSLLFPLVCASLANFCLGWLQKTATHFVIHRFLAGNSVLGFAIPAADATHAYVRQSMLLLLPFSLAVRVLAFCLYVGGFLLTARLVRDAVCGQSLDWRGAAQFLRARLGRIFLFSWVVLLFSALVGVLGSAVFAVQTFLLLHGYLSFMAAARIATFLVAAVLLWIMLPSALRLIADAPEEEIPAHRKLLGRIAGVVAAAMVSVLIACAASLNPHIAVAFENQAILRNCILGPAISIVEDLPLGLLWVFLGVLQFGGQTREKA
jgi:uncharacterized membrane protein